ncbi:MAG: hypothetical protein AB4426_29520 [Xenococcaceae cyanobacterium]
MKSVPLAAATFLWLNIANALTNTPAFSQYTRSAVCVEKFLTLTAVRIDDECEVQQVNSNTTLIHWSDGFSTRVELRWDPDTSRKFSGKIDDTNVSGYGINTPNESCFSWDNFKKEICFRYLTQKPKLSPGNYWLRLNKLIAVYSRNGRFCLVGASRHGSQVQSLSASSTDPNTYIPDYWGGFLYAVDSSTVTWRGAEYSWFSAISDIPPDVQRCLNSNQPFFKQN